MNYTSHLQISFFGSLVYTSFILLTLIYFINKYGIKKDTIIYLLIFYEGLFGAFSSYGVIPLQYYRAILFIYLFFYSRKYLFVQLTNKDLMVNIAFLIFMLSFFITTIINGGNLLNILSQFFFKYSILFLLYHVFRNEFKNVKKRKKTTDMILTFIYIQLFLSVVKVFLFGFMEAIVGSLSAKGAAVAVVFPIYAMIFYIVLNNEGGKISNKKWLITVMFIIVAFVSLKRSPIFIFPLMLLLMATYVTNSFKLINLLKYLPITVLLLYIGIMSNPSLNKNRVAWGDFDIVYTTSYILQYNFGVSNTSEINSKEVYQGRGASLFVVFSPDKLYQFSTVEKLFGMGVSKFRDIDEELWWQKHFGLYGVAGFALYQIITLGYIGLITYLFFIFSIFNTMKNKKLRNVLAGFVLWEIFLYQGFSVTSNAMDVLLIAIIMMSNNIYYSNYLLKPQKIKI